MSWPAARNCTKPGNRASPAPHADGAACRPTDVPAVGLDKAISGTHRFFSRAAIESMIGENPRGRRAYIPKYSMSPSKTFERFVTRSRSLIRSLKLMSFSWQPAFFVLTHRLTSPPIPELSM